MSRVHFIWHMVDLPSKIEVALHVDGLGLKSLMFVGKLGLDPLR